MHCECLQCSAACFAGDYSKVTLHGGEVGSLPGAIPDAFQERPGNAGVCKEYTLNIRIAVSDKYRLLEIDTITLKVRESKAILVSVLGAYRAVRC
jgi:hypothetical protein